LVVLAGCSRSAETAVPVKRAALPTGVPAAAPEEEAARRSQIAHEIAAIESECRTAAAGDWQRWENETARYRSQLKERVDALNSHGAAPPAYLAGRDLPIFQIKPKMGSAHIINPMEWNEFRTNRPVVAGSKWLRKRGIDVIFVSVPSMPEIYIDQFLNVTPADGIIAPHIRQTFLQLLQSDVEVVDTFQLMRAARGRGFQYLPADHHWNQLGMRATVQDIARRLSRYHFGRDAKQAAPVSKTTSGPYKLPLTDTGKPWRPMGAEALSERQWNAALGMLPGSMDYITAPDGSPLADDPASPVMLIGNSYAIDFRELLIRETNLRIRTRWGNGHTTQALAEFLREPEQLNGVRVIIWITADEFLFMFRYLPPEIREVLDDAE
jgi:hypothetical protein